MELLPPEVDNRGKGRNLRWTSGMDECMIETFLHQARLGNKGEKGFISLAYKAVISALANRLKIDVCRKHIDHRLKSFRKEYRSYSFLREQSGFVWDPDKNKVTAPDSIWNSYIKANPKLKCYRGRACRWNFDSLAIIVGKDCSPETSAADNPNFSDSESELDNKGKGGQVRWSQEMDECMIRIFAEQARLGLKSEKGFRSQAYGTVCKALSDLDVDVSRNHIDNRLRTLRSEYHMFRTLREQNGFTWDAVRNMVTAPDAIWNDYLKVNPKFRFCRGRQCKWDFDSLGIIVGDNLAAGALLVCLESRESQPEVENKGKGSQLRWHCEMDECMIKTLIEQVKIGNKVNRGFRDQAYDAVRKALAVQLDVDVSKKHIDNRLKTLRTEYHMFRTLREQDGFDWSLSENMVIASDSAWNDFILENPKFKHYQGRACRWDYDSLGIIVGNDHKNGNFSMDAPNDVVMTSCPVPTKDIDLSEEIPLIDEDMGLTNTDEETDRLSQDVRRSLPCTEHGQLGKKPRIDDVGREVMDMVKYNVIREVMDMVKTEIGSITKSVDGLSFTKQLYAEVMKVEGFTSDFLDRAFEILKRDGHGAEIFLVRSEPYRKRMLKELYEKYGDNDGSNRNENKRMA